MRKIDKVLSKEWDKRTLKERELQQVYYRLTALLHHSKMKQQGRCILTIDEFTWLRLTVKKEIVQYVNRWKELPR